MPTYGLVPLKIAIIGGGFSGAAFVAACYRLSHIPLEIYLFEQSGEFGTGKAYCTPFAYHLLNVRAKEMSIYEDHPQDFVNWLYANQTGLCKQTTQLAEQFAPRYLYGLYLKNLLDTIQKDHQSVVRLHFIPQEVIDVTSHHEQPRIVTCDQQIRVDKIILALGNTQPAHFKFPVSSNVGQLNNPWDYKAPNQIKQDEPVAIVGTGLSMIDAVLTLYHQNHRGLIYAISRHGLLPLPHANQTLPHSTSFHLENVSLRNLMQNLRHRSQEYIETGKDWRTVINTVRQYIPTLWTQLSVRDKKCFIRHVLPYWNIHRHRVHDQIYALLQQLRIKGQLNIIAGSMVAADVNKTIVRLRHTQEFLELKIQWLINCMGPNLNIAANPPLLIKQLIKRGFATFDTLQIGLSVSEEGALRLENGETSSTFYTIGSLRKGCSWEVGAVPEIRKQCFDLVRHLLAIH